MIVVFFDNEEYATVSGAVSAEYELAHLPQAAIGTYFLVCKDAEGKKLGEFQFSKIVGWCYGDEDEDDEDEDDEDEEGKD